MNKTTPSSKKKDAVEDELWRSVKADTRPLDAKRRVVGSSPTKKSAEKKVVTASRKQRLSRKGIESTPAKEAAKGGAHDRRSAQKLKRGQFPIDARLDLHGMTQDEAHRTLNAALSRACRQGKRTILVITGKGAGKKGSGVLRRNVPRWLGEAPLAGVVIGYSEARMRDGGEGALYIRLRRQQPLS